MKTPKYNHSFLIEQTLIMEDWWEKKVESKIKNDFFALVVATSWVCYLILIFFIVVFIEAPIRRIIYKGNIRDKITSWFKIWKSAYNGFKDGS